MNPKISVIIPTYNRPDRLERAINSVLNQSFQDFEIIIVDDGVKERADKVIEGIDDNRIIYIQHSVNKGVSEARNTGVKKARGRYITFLDDDDEYLLNKLEIQYKIMEEYLNQIDFTFCLVDIYRDNKLINTQNIDLDEGIQNIYEDFLALRIKITTPSIFCKKEKILEVGGFDSSFLSGEEWDLIAKLSKKNDCYFLKESLIKINILDKGEHLGGSFVNKIKGREKIIEKYEAEFLKRPEIYAKHLFQLAVLYQKDKNLKKSTSLSLKSWQKDIFNISPPKQILKNLYLRVFEKAFKKESK